MKDGKTNPKGLFYNGRLGLRIVTYMFIASAVLSVFTTGFQALLLYRNDVARIDAEFEMVQDGFNTSLQNALWEFNFEQTRLLIDGILAQEDVVHVALETVSGQGFEQGESGVPDTRVEAYELAYRQYPGVVVPVGTIKVTRSFDKAFVQLRSQIIVVLLSNFATTLAASFVMFLIFDRMVSRHLLAITSTLRTPDWYKVQPEIALDRDPKRQDELSEIVRALNASWHSIQEANADAQLVGNRLETVLNTVTSGIVALNADGMVVMVNPTARHLLGGISEVTPFLWPTVIQFLDAEGLAPLDASADPIQRALTGHNLRSETHLMGRNDVAGVGRYVRIESQKLDNPRDDISTVIIIDDVSVQERNRQVVERKSRLDGLEHLTGGIAHDFNNLLASLLYAVDLARRQENKTKRNDLLNIAINSIDRGQELTSRLLAFAKKQPGLAKSRRAVDVFAEFETMIGTMLDANLSISFEVEDENLQIYCDHTQLETALLNLVLNGRDAILRSGQGGHVSVRARCVAFPRPDPQPTGNATDIIERADKNASAYRYTEISVSDNGPGMTEETRVRAIDPFFTTKDKNSGTGLGLSIVYGFVRQSDGTLRIYSEEGVGTTVNLILPRGTMAGTREVPMPLDSPIEGHGETVLLVEDKEDLLLLMVATLEDLGFRVLQARSGNEALKLLEEGHTFDVLLTDVVMAGSIGGFELARRVRALMPDVPVIYTSGYTGFTAQEMGAVQAPILQKPAPPVELAAALHEALRPLKSDA